MKIFYHNITKKLFNEIDREEFIDNISEGDDVMYSVAGSALIEEFEGKERIALWNEWFEYHNKKEDNGTDS